MSDENRRRKKNELQSEVSSDENEKVDENLGPSSKSVDRAAVKSKDKRRAKTSSRCSSDGGRSSTTTFRFSAKKEKKHRSDSGEPHSHPIVVKKSLDFSLSDLESDVVDDDVDEIGAEALEDTIQEQDDNARLIADSRLSDHRFLPEICVAVSSSPPVGASVETSSSRASMTSPLKSPATSSVKSSTLSHESRVTIIPGSPKIPTSNIDDLIGALSDEDAAQDEDNYSDDFDSDDEECSNFPSKAEQTLVKSFERITLENDREEESREEVPTRSKNRPEVVIFSSDDERDLDETGIVEIEMPQSESESSSRESNPVEPDTIPILQLETIADQSLPKEMVISDESSRLSLSPASRSVAEPSEGGGREKSNPSRVHSFKSPSVRSDSEATLGDEDEIGDSVEHPIFSEQGEVDKPATDQVDARGRNDRVSLCEVEPTTFFPTKNFAQDFREFKGIDFAQNFKNSDKLDKHSSDPLASMPFDPNDQESLNQTKRLKGKESGTFCSVESSQLPFNKAFTHLTRPILLKDKIEADADNTETFSLSSSKNSQIHEKPCLKSKYFQNKDRTTQKKSPKRPNNLPLKEITAKDNYDDDTVISDLTSFKSDVSKPPSDRLFHDSTSKNKSLWGSTGNDNRVENVVVSKDDYLKPIETFETKSHETQEFKFGAPRNDVRNDLHQGTLYRYSSIGNLKSPKETEDFVETLQAEYSALLMEHARIRNVIDKLKIDSKLNFINTISPSRETETRSESKRDCLSSTILESFPLNSRHQEQNGNYIPSPTTPSSEFSKADRRNDQTDGAVLDYSFDNSKVAAVSDWVKNIPASLPDPNVDTSAAPSLKYFEDNAPALPPKSNSICYSDGFENLITSANFQEPRLPELPPKRFRKKSLYLCQFIKHFKQNMFNKTNFLDEKIELFLKRQENKSFVEQMKIYKSMQQDYDDLFEEFKNKKLEYSKELRKCRTNGLDLSQFDAELDKDKAFEGLFYKLGKKLDLFHENLDRAKSRSVCKISNNNNLTSLLDDHDLAVISSDDEDIVDIIMDGESKLTHSISTPLLETSFEHRVKGSKVDKVVKSRLSKRYSHSSPKISPRSKLWYDSGKEDTHVAESNKSQIEAAIKMALSPMTLSPAGDCDRRVLSDLRESWTEKSLPSKTESNSSSETRSSVESTVSQTKPCEDAYIDPTYLTEPFTKNSSSGNSKSYMEGNQAHDKRITSQSQFPFHEKLDSFVGYSRQNQDIDRDSGFIGSEGSRPSLQHFGASKQGLVFQRLPEGHVSECHVKNRNISASPTLFTNDIRPIPKKISPTIDQREENRCDSSCISKGDCSNNAELLRSLQEEVRQLKVAVEQQRDMMSQSNIEFESRERSRSINDFRYGSPFRRRSRSQNSRKSIETQASTGARPRFLTPSGTSHVRSKVGSGYCEKSKKSKKKEFSVKSKLNINNIYTNNHQEPNYPQQIYPKKNYRDYYSPSDTRLSQMYQPLNTYCGNVANVSSQEDFRFNTIPKSFGSSFLSPTPYICSSCCALRRGHDEFFTAPYAASHTNSEPGYQHPPSPFIQNPSTSYDVASYSPRNYKDFPQPRGDIGVRKSAGLRVESPQGSLAAAHYLHKPPAQTSTPISRNSRRQPRRYLSSVADSTRLSIAPSDSSSSSTDGRKSKTFKNSNNNSRLSKNARPLAKEISFSSDGDDDKDNEAIGTHSFMLQNARVEHAINAATDLQQSSSRLLCEMQRNLSRSLVQLDFG